MSRRLALWFPAAVLLVGAAMTVGVDTQRALPLRDDLADAVPVRIDGYVGTDEQISPEELKVAGVSDYLFRIFRPAASAEADEPAAEPDTAAAALPFSLYVGYYERQERGTTIHSPRNCLPGAGWEALTSADQPVAVGGDTVIVNRYLIQREDEEAMVLYWYQGRGRVASNEYRVKLDLLRDTALRGRSDEALVRIVVPVETTTRQALDRAIAAAQAVIPALWQALPA